MCLRASSWMLWAALGRPPGLPARSGLKASVHLFSSCSQGLVWYLDTTLRRDSNKTRRKSLSEAHALLRAEAVGSRLNAAMLLHLTPPTLVGLSERL